MNNVIWRRYSWHRAAHRTINLAPCMTNGCSRHPNGLPHFASLRDADNSCQDVFHCRAAGLQEACFKIRFRKGRMGPGKLFIAFICSLLLAERIRGLPDIAGALRPGAMYCRGIESRIFLPVRSVCANNKVISLFFSLPPMHPDYPGSPLLPDVALGRRINSIYNESQNSSSLR